MHQTTIMREFTCTGTGLHSGDQVQVKICPAPENTGIIFELNTVSGIKSLELSPECVISTGLATTIGSTDFKVSTVEHLLATVRGLNIDNLIIKPEGQEIPILDGSASEWVRLFSQAGIKKQEAKRIVYVLKRPFEVKNGDKYIKASPHNGFYVDCTIDFPHKSIGQQQMSIELTASNFMQISKARTFGFLREVEYLQKNGLARGGSLDNAIVLDDNGVLNSGGLRYDNEFVRHKTLDFVGDMAMLSYPLLGRFETFCSGHELNNIFLREAMKAGVLQAVEAIANKEIQSDTKIVCGKWVAA